MKDIANKHDWLKRSLPHVNFDLYDLENLEERKNTKRHQKIYPMRLFVTIQEKLSPPDNS